MRFHSQAMVQVLDVPLVLPKKKPEFSGFCPECGGPAEVEEFWSRSCDEPGVRILKRQICCGGRPGKGSRFRGAPPVHCPVVVEILERQPDCEVEAVATPQEPVVLLKKLDRVVEFLALLDEAGEQEVWRLARLTRQLQERKAALRDARK